VAVEVKVRVQLPPRAVPTALGIAHPLSEPRKAEESLPEDGLQRLDVDRVLDNQDGRDRHQVRRVVHAQPGRVDTGQRFVGLHCEGGAGERPVRRAQEGEARGGQSQDALGSRRRMLLGAAI